MLVKSSSIDVDATINEKSGKVWSIPFEDLNPAGNDDYVLYIKNTGDKVLHISKVKFAASAATQVEIHRVTGTASGGTAITPVSRTLGSAATISGTVESGTDITGLTNAGILDIVSCKETDTDYESIEASNLRIPKGQALAVLVEVGTANLTGIITIVEEE
jgi:archaellum component FlaG (FlaF/FlaG flagellin family)